MRALMLVMVALSSAVSMFGGDRANAQDYPAKPVRIVMGMPAGGSSDTLARALARELNTKWGKSVLIDNRPGASGVVAAINVKQSPADGYTFLFISDTQFTSTTFMAANKAYDPLTDFEPVVGLANIYNLLVSNPKLGLKNVADLVTKAKQSPNQLHYGTFGLGSSTHLAAASLSRGTGIKATVVDYRGGPEVLKALMQDEVDFAFTGLTPALPLVQANQIAALGWGGDQRSPTLPNVPTFAEQGVEIASGGWLGLLAPRGTPKVILDKVASDAQEVVSRPEFIERWLLQSGLDSMNGDPAELRKLLQQDLDVYGPLVKSMNLTPQ